MDERELDQKACTNALETLKNILDQKGITADYLTEKLKEELDATETKVFQYRGGIVEKSDLIAWEIRQRARQDAHKLRGDYVEKHHHTIEGGLPMVPLTPEEQLDLEARKQIIKERTMKEAKK